MTFKGGAIPIYWGDDEVLEGELNFNPKAYINVNRFPNLDAVAEYVVQLSNDPAKLAQMRSEPIFKNGEMPDIFRINSDDINNPTTQEYGKILRERYFAEIARNAT